jgi:Holliday junction resolvasome RuvABC endonuclease subunit
MNCGWAVVRPRTGLVVDAGLLESDRAVSGIAKSTDWARRIAGQGRELRAVIARHGCTAIAVEQALFHGPPNAVVPQLLCWGDLIGIAVTLELALYEVLAKDWQHAILECEGAIDYELVAKHILAFVAGQVGQQLAAIAPSKRTHVYDAIGVALYAALSHPIRIIGARAAA